MHSKTVWRQEGNRWPPHMGTGLPGASQLAPAGFPGSAITVIGWMNWRIPAAWPVTRLWRPPPGGFRPSPSSPRACG